ncbi:probable protein arginine N-methyltransferase 6 [Pomacea canaliculata]|nr:probable protein arginine N-methyltransferase 6 [Pomacea canaliculata]
MATLRDAEEDRRDISLTSTDDHDGYFSSYADPYVHEVMLRDWPRMASYKRFFENNAHLIRDKVVMDVGAGTGILSLFAASAGVRKVYAIEASNIAALCQKIVEQNGFKDKIEVIQSTVEDLQLGDDVKMDVIVSEWMGFYLLHESMLDSVIVARDRFLAEDGIMVPSRASLFLAPVNMEIFLEDKLEFWNNICGFDFTPAIPYVQHRLLREPVTTKLEQHQVLASPQTVAEFDLNTVTLVEVQAVSRCLTFKAEKSSTVHGFVLWFDVDFAVKQGSPLKNTNSQSSDGVNSQLPEVHNWTVISPSILSTSPASPETHWKQTVIILPQAVSVDANDAIGCRVDLEQDTTNKRHYNITLELVGEDMNEETTDDSIESDGEDHPVPCECEHAKCRLIRALMEKYDQEHDALENEAKVTDITAEMEAADTVGAEIEKDSAL